MDSLALEFSLRKLKCAVADDLAQQRVTTLQPKSKKLKFYLTLQQQI